MCRKHTSRHKVRAAYKYRKPMMRAGRRIGRAYKKYSKRKQSRKIFSRTTIGENPGTGTTKKFQVQNINPTSKLSRALYVLNLTEVPHQDDSIDTHINYRERHLVNLRGFRFCI
jgi:hypothetical protein